jgi:fructokinase
MLQLLFASTFALAPDIGRVARPNVLCVGEALFDGLPSGIFLGGSPLNVACHLADQGADVRYASAVGKDRLGTEALRRLRSRGVDTSLVDVRLTEETGFVTVTLDEQTGDASYEFLTPAAWDFVKVDGIADAARLADAVVYATLAQRDGDKGTTRDAVRTAVAAAHLAVCDINLRPPFAHDEVVAASARAADLLKLNEDELLPVARALGDAPAIAACVAAAEAEAAPKAIIYSDLAGVSAADVAASRLVAGAARAIGRAARTPCVVVTRASRGAILWQASLAPDGVSAALHEPGEALECGGFVAPANDAADTVGAGDAFLAALLAALLRGASTSSALEAACRLGAFVVGQQGATPAQDPYELSTLRPVCTEGADECVVPIGFADDS